MDNKKHINVEELSDLCRLSLSDGEKAALEKDLESIIAFAKAVDMADTASETGADKINNVFRPDTPSEKAIAAYTELARVKDEEYFAVPKAVD